MRVAKEIAVVDDLRGVIERFVVDQDRAEHGFLRLEIVRKRAVRCSEVSQGSAAGKEKGAPDSAPSQCSRVRT